MEKNQKKLVLNKKVLASLDAPKLSQIFGGGDSINTQFTAIYGCCSTKSITNSKCNC